MYARQNPTIVDRVMAVGYPMEESMINPRLRSDPPAALADWLLGKIPANDPARLDAPKGGSVGDPGCLFIVEFD